MWVKGDRKDYYEAETDFNILLRNGLLATLRKKLDTAGMQLAQVESTLSTALEKLDGENQKEIEAVSQRLQKARQFHQKVTDILGNPLIEHFL